MSIANVSLPHADKHIVYIFLAEEKYLMRVCMVGDKQWPSPEKHLFAS